MLLLLILSDLPDGKVMTLGMIKCYKQVKLILLTYMFV